jgi:hypothetical protein
VFELIAWATAAHLWYLAALKTMLRSLRLLCFSLVILTWATGARAQETTVAPGEQETSHVSDQTAEPINEQHMFGFLPNYATVEDGHPAIAVTTAQTFKMAALGSFDPYVFPFVGVIAGLDSGAHDSYAARYATALADNTTGNFLTTAVVPALTGQDPRYFELGSGSVLHRLAYAATRSVVTRSRSGAKEFNVSELGGNLIAAELSGFYRTTDAERTMTATLARWGMQVMWDTVSNELKEFWPDVRAHLHHHPAAR